MNYSNVAVLSAINSLLSDRYEAAGAQTFDGKRDVYASAGYPETVAPADYRRQYERQDLAKRIVEIVADYTWKGDTWLQDTEGVDDSPFEAAWRALVASRAAADGDTAPGALHYLARADIVAGMGRYAVMLLGVKDGKALSEPMEAGTLKTPDDLLYLSIFAEDSAGIATWDKDTGSRRYGKPLAYNLTTLRGDEKKVEPVHWTRCVHIADGALTNDVFGTPRLQAVYNRLLDIEKVLAATGEGGWRIMNPSVIFSTREGYELPRPDARMPADMRQKLEDARDEQQSQIDELVHGLRRALALEGLEPHWQDTEMQDPSGAVEVYLKMISAGTGIPLRILTGSERGELASSQDEANWASVIEARRTRYAEPLVLRPLVNRLQWAGALPQPVGGVYVVNWSVVQAPDPNEAAQRADTYASALQKVGVQVDGKAFVEAFVPDLPESAVIDAVTPDLPEAPEGEEVQANAGFFDAGTFTRNAMILQLDPGNPDAEADAIAAVAGEYEDDIAAALRRTSQSVVSGLDERSLRDIERLLPTADDDLREALERLLSASAGRGARVSIEKMKQVYIGVDWTLVNEDARDWARRYSYDLVSLLDDNSRTMLQGAVSRWIESGEPLDVLVDDVARIFGAERARLIAVTEATRAYAEGSFTGYEAAGFNRRPPESDRPPGHPGCRCWVSLAQAEPGLWEYVWLTAMDERVCPICAPKHRTSIGFAGRR